MPLFGLRHPCENFVICFWPPSYVLLCSVLDCRTLIFSRRCPDAAVTAAVTARTLAEKFPVLARAARRGPLSVRCSSHAGARRYTRRTRDRLPCTHCRNLSNRQHSSLGTAPITTPSFESQPTTLAQRGEGRNAAFAGVSRACTPDPSKTPRSIASWSIFCATGENR